jgi:hypothetical protein
LAPRLQASKSLEEIQDHVMAAIRDAHSSFSLSREEFSALRKRVLVEAYRCVPRKLLLEVQALFDLDFELFEYDKEPEDIFES